MNLPDIHQTIARLRRDMPRNATAMALCQACEELMRARTGRAPLTRAEIQKNYRLRQAEKLENGK